MTSKNIYTIFKTKDVNIHFLKRYMWFISTRIQYQGYKEKHHILPKSIYPEYSKEKWNLVSLSAREHFIAHWILSKIFNKIDIKFKMLKAFHRMTVFSKNIIGRSTVSSYLYEQAKKANSYAMSIKNPMHDKDVKNKAIEKMKEYYESEKGKEAMKIASEKRKNVDNISDEAKKKLSLLWKGVPRPKTKKQIEKNIKSSSLGIFHTPFGDFYSPNQASGDEKNEKKYSRFQIDKRCKNNLEGYSFTSFNKDTQRGKWIRS